VLVRPKRAACCLCAMSVHRKARAEEWARLGELAARNAILDTTDDDDDGAQAIQREYKELASKMCYLQASAEALWRPEFGAVLKTSHSMRVISIPTTSSKECMRPVNETCMACGRKERNCKYAVDLAGSFDASAWTSGVNGITREYGYFTSEYESVFAKTFVPSACRRRQLPDVDKGRYVIGETCLRKAQLRFLTQTFLLDICYEAEHDLQRLTEAHGLTEFDRSVFYTVPDDARSVRLVDKLYEIELAIADASHPLPCLETDDAFWSVIDAARFRVAGGSAARQSQLLCQRADAMLQASASKPDSDDASDGGTETSEMPRTRSKTKRRRHNLVESDDDADDAGQAAASQPAPKTQPPSASGMAASQRAAGVLPSRRAALKLLMELQLRLAREDRLSDAAVCTNAIMTLQELMQR